MGDHILEHKLFGGAITTNFPQRLQDLSIICPVPDHQEVFVDPSRDESLIFELLDSKEDVADDGSATHFFLDLANEQDAGGVMVMEQSGVLVSDWLCFQQVPSLITTIVGQMDISKGRQGREAQNTVKVCLANIRLKGVRTDVLVTTYEPLFINPLSTAAGTMGAGRRNGKAMDDIFKLAVSTFMVKDWSLFATST